MRLSPADRMINEQIARELDRLNSIFPDEEEKAAIIQRIADLKAMLSTTPVQVCEPSEPTVRQLFAQLIQAIRYR